MELATTAFSPGGLLPVRYTCQGQDVSPALSWGGVPEGTFSLCLILEDPDAPAGLFTHWILFNIPASITALPEAASHGHLPAAGQSPPLLFPALCPKRRSGAKKRRPPPGGGARHKGYGAGRSLAYGSLSEVLASSPWLSVSSALASSWLSMGSFSSLSVI